MKEVWVWTYNEVTVSEDYETEGDATSELTKNLIHCNYSGNPGCVELPKFGFVPYGDVHIQKKFGGKNVRGD